MDKDYLIEHITEEQILSLLNDLGAKQFGAIKKNEIWFNTICHGGNSHKLCYFRNTKEFYCYTNCGKMSLFNLVMKVKECSFSQSLSIVSRAAGINQRYGFAIDNHSVSKEIRQIDHYINMRRHKPKKSIEHLPKIDDRILNYFDENTYYTGWINEGISIETMHLFGIRWYELEQHIIIPHFNMNNELIGIRRRSLQEKDKNNKYMPEIIEGHTYAHQLNLNLYGLNLHIKGIKKYKKVVLVESEKSVMLAHDYYQDDAFVVATCGFNISNWHRDMILSLGVEEVILAYDKDFNPLQFEDFDERDPEFQKYERFVTRIESLAHKFTTYCRTYVLWDKFNLLDLKDSPFDKGKDVLEQLMKNKVEITTNNNV